MNLKEAQELFEKQFKRVVRGGTTAYAPNGAAYVVVCGGGVKPEGEPTPAKFASEELAAEWWLDAAIKFAGLTGHNVLYWREEPGIEWEPLTVENIKGLSPRYCIVYSRFTSE